MSDEFQRPLMKSLVNRMGQRKSENKAASSLPAPACSPISFLLTQEQTDTFAKWSKNRLGHGPIGGRITVSFTGTSIGTIVRAKDQQTGEEIDLSDYENW